MGAFFLQRRFFAALFAVAALFAFGHFVPGLAGAARVGLLVLGGLLVLDAVLLFGRGRLAAARALPARLSNGDANEVRVALESHYPMPVRVTVLDELPVQLQVRDLRLATLVAPHATATLRYSVRPVRRGRYAFGRLNVYATTALGLCARRFRVEAAAEVPVYPSFLQMRRYELLAVSNRLEEVGVKKVRRVGHTMEFDQIREYVEGDDVRTVNWKATARRGALMVNQHRDERAQPVYCLLDLGRVMKSPFDEMTLLDYSVNAALVLSNIALLRQDRAGLVTFSDEIAATVPAERTPRQIYTLMEALYHVETDFRESDYARLHAHLRRLLKQRSLLLLFTNFETRAALRRQLPFLRALGRQHVVVAVFFENTALRGLLEGMPTRTEDIYVKTIAEKFAFEKREIVKELARHGVQSILTPPEQLTVATVNRYLALKARGVV